MTKDGKDEGRVFAGALPVSGILHAAAILLLMFGLPISLFEPTKDDVISVDLVAPSEQAEPPPPPEQAQPEEKKEAKGDATPNDAIRPVVQFGEEDAGPHVSRSGASAVENATAPTQQADKEDEAPTASLALAGKAPGSAPRSPASGTPATDKTGSAETKKPLELDEAKTLFSPSTTADGLATSAMDKLPRSARAAQLCATQLRDQLRNGMPPYYPELVPSYPLLGGTVMEVPDAAFRASRRWYELRFRCEIDADATKVVAFAFRVGKTIPRSEWEKRGLPAAD